MPKDSSRVRKVNEQIKRELARILNSEVKDPRVKLITVNAVEVSPDFNQARVYLTSLNPDQDHAAVISTLESMSGYIRGELGRSIRLRATPRLTFIYDESVEHGTRMAGLIDQVIAEDREKETAREDAGTNREKDSLPGSGDQ